MGNGEWAVVEFGVRSVECGIAAEFGLAVSAKWKLWMIGIDDGTGNDMIAGGASDGEREIVGASSENSGKLRTIGAADLVKITLVTCGDGLEVCVMSDIWFRDEFVLVLPGRIFLGHCWASQQWHPCQAALSSFGCHPLRFGDRFADSPEGFGQVD